MSRRQVFSKVLGASALLGAAAANAEIDYAGVGYLGGAKTIDVNNANIRVYQKLPGVYPNAAGKIVSKAPYKSKEDMYAKAGFSAPEAAAVKKYDSNFIYLEPRPEYIVRCRRYRRSLLGTSEPPPSCTLPPSHTLPLPAPLPAFPPPTVPPPTCLRSQIDNINNGLYR